MTSRSLRDRSRYFWPSLKGPARYQQLMRILIFHGYLLRGTGSNVYNASLARALKGLGHEVHLLCQDRGAGELEWVDALGSWADGALAVEWLREQAGPGSVTVYTPEIGGLLPVYVADRY